MITKKEKEQIDPVEKTMRRVVWSFIAISTVISLIYLWVDSRQQTSENNIKAAINKETAIEGKPRE